MHEVMCPADDSHLTVAFDEHFVIMPSIRLFERDCNYENDVLGEIGKPVTGGFEYNSQNNPQFLNTKQILEFNE